LPIPPYFTQLANMWMRCNNILHLIPFNLLRFSTFFFTKPESVKRDGRMRVN
jgi:hypothetical protein